jgi:hypothetical protein
MPFDLTVAAGVLSFFIKGMTLLSRFQVPRPADRACPGSAPADSYYMVLALFSLEEFPAM